MSHEDLEFLYCGSCSREMALERDFLKEMNYLSCPYCMEPMLIETLMPGRSNYSKRNLKEYAEKTMPEKSGISLVSKTYGARWKEDLPRDLADILFKEISGKAVEVIIKPEDQDCHHWSIEYAILRWVEGRGYARVKDFEDPRTEGD